MRLLHPVNCLKAVRLLFWFWYAVGLVLMLFASVPKPLHAANGLFLLFFTIYACCLFYFSFQHIELQRNSLRRRLWLWLPAAGALTLLIEQIGTATGLPFGAYTYSDTLRLVGEEVPIAIGAAWAGIAAMAVLMEAELPRLRRALLVGLYAVVLDLVLDPVAHARQMWIWERVDHSFVFYSVPVQNFVSWFVIAAVLSLAFPRFTPSPVIRFEAVRLYQGMLLMFGLLAVKEMLWLPAILAGAAIAVMERRRAAWS